MSGLDLSLLGLPQNCNPNNNGGQQNRNWANQNPAMNGYPNINTGQQNQNGANKKPANEGKQNRNGANLNPANKGKPNINNGQQNRNGGLQNLTNRGHPHNNGQQNQNGANRNYKNPFHENTELSTDLKRLWTQLKTFAGQKGFAGNPPVSSTNREQWLQLWSAVATGADGEMHVLLTALLKLPDSVTLMPAVDDVVTVLCLTVSKISNKDQLEDVARWLESVADVIRDRLVGKMEKIVDFSGIDMSLERLLADFKNRAKYLVDSLFDRYLGILNRVKEIEQYKIQVKNQATCMTSFTETEVEVLSSWSTPSVRWLMSGSWHKVPPLQSHYKDAAEYASTLEKIWTLLTFYWGAAALWPKCTYADKGKGEDSHCGEPMLRNCGSHSHEQCRNKRNGVQCTRHSAWKCHKYNHDQICTPCLLQKQEMLIGPPSRLCSTDIYDATVNRETTRRDGSVYTLTGLMSRKPPTIDPNWRTTYRLQPAALVAVVRLGSRNQRLSKDCPLQWAEVIALDQNTEWQSRQAGRISLRLLSRGDCPSLSAECDLPLEMDSKVAIIDLRVFVPEVISVLATLGGPQFAQHFSQIPFQNQLLGHTAPPSKHVYQPTLGVVENIQSAIQHSEIDFIHRLDAAGHEILAQRIFALPQVKTLYGTQLEAFTAALASSAHCVQGPPGTGKSYIGVCLVLALDVIRTMAESKGKSVGPSKRDLGPLVLSLNLISSLSLLLP